MAIEKGQKVKVHYTGTFEDGEVFDSSEKQGKPLEFICGTGQMIPGFDAAVIGMEKGESKDIKLNPEDAYGEHNPQLVQKVPIDQMPKEPKPEVGMMLAVGLPNGQQLPAKITEVTETDVTIDVNHPMSGKVLNFNIKIEDYSELSEEEKAEIQKQEEALKTAIEAQKEQLAKAAQEQPSKEECSPADCSGCSGNCGSSEETEEDKEE
jgi:peptidylprolyl isomerase